ncbi:hypothetical protein PEC301653_03610 [Pectobacterium carotovorum subsp. carotovorum]|nr:hypothetical protein PEC301653_03610 [Pectobacterium carotovorum subsp. carotovorum]
MLTVLFYVLLGMAAAHFIYERILLPSIRLHYRNKLFELRDGIRREIINCKSGEDNQAAQLVHEALNNAINRLHFMTLPNRVRAQKRLANNPEIQAKIKREVELVTRVANNQVLETITKSVGILDKVLMFNSLMLLIYTFPIFLVVFVVAKVVKTVNSLLSALIEQKSLEQAVMLLPDKQVAKLVQSEKFAYV